MKILITEKISNSGIALLKRYCEVTCKFGISRDELLACIAEYDAMIIRADTKIDRILLDKAKKLKAIGMAGIGLNHIDVDYAKEKNVTVFNVPDGSNESVAELTIGLMLNIVRKVDAAVQDTKEKNVWNKHAFMGRQLKGKVLGIIALGKIGTRVAQFCQVLGMKIIAYDPYLDKTRAAELKVELVSLEELLSQADIISVHAPLTKDTYHLLGTKELKKMKKGAYLINLGRGGIIDEESLYLALKEGHLAGAAVDVMEEEPPGKSKLFELDNFIVTPHIGAGTVEAQDYIALNIAKKVLNHLKLA